MAVFSYTEGWYNPARRHSGIGYLSPIAYEADMATETTMKPNISDKPSTETGQLHYGCAG